jgi:hypothetical protein
MDGILGNPAWRGRGATPDFVLVDEPVWARPPPDERKVAARLTIVAEMLARAGEAAEDLMAVTADRLRRMLRKEASKSGMELTGEVQLRSWDDPVSGDLVAEAVCRARPVSQMRGVR